MSMPAQSADHADEEWSRFLEKNQQAERLRAQQQQQQ
jgi:hypothetical protein